MRTSSASRQCVEINAPSVDNMQWRFYDRGRHWTSLEHAQEGEILHINNLKYTEMNTFFLEGSVFTMNPCQSCIPSVSQSSRTPFDI